MPPTRGEKVSCAVIERLGLAALLLCLTTAFARAEPVFHTLTLGSETFDTEWHTPAAKASGLVLLQHGFGRRCANLRGTARVLADAGLLVLCLNGDMARGNPALAAAYARALLAGEVPSPDGMPLPAPVVVAGHSAGGLFAAHLGQAIAIAEPRRLAGVLLLDVVGGDALRDALAALSPRPVLAIVAPPSPCNARQQALPVLRALSRNLEIIDPGPSATHLDAEGEDSERVAIWACREGPPLAANVALLRHHARRATLDMVRACCLSPAAASAPMPPPAPTPARGR